MKRTMVILALGVAVAGLGGCTSYGGGCCPSPCGVGVPVAAAPSGQAIRVSDARMAQKIEMQVGYDGAPKEIEYHILPEQVPDAVQKAMDDLHPGGAFTGAEKEYEGGVLYYELTREADGHEIEAMFTPGGSLHSEEIAVSEENVPDAVKAAIAKTWPEGAVRTWEEIRDSKRELKEYHVKLTQDGMNYKVMVSPGGTVKSAVREVVAEIEVPVPVAR